MYLYPLINLHMEFYICRLLCLEILVATYCKIQDIKVHALALDSFLHALLTVYFKALSVMLE